MPSASHPKQEPAPHFNDNWISDFSKDDEDTFTTPNQMRWQPLKIPEEKHTFIEGIKTMCGAGEPSLKVSLSLLSHVMNISNS